MKKLSLTTLIFVFLLLISYGIQAQSVQTSLNQVELAKQFIGTWQGVAGKDTVQMWEGKPYGKALVINVYMVIKGKKSDLYMSCFGYDDRDDKLKGINLLTDANYETWIGAFTADRIFKVDGLDTFKPELVKWKAEFNFKTPSEVVISHLNTDGIKTGEWTYKKVK